MRPPTRLRRTKDHTITANGTPSTWLLWRANCAQHTCSPQGANWTPNRAGWCPGDRAYGEDVDITAPITPGAAVTIGYESAIPAPLSESCWSPGRRGW